MPQSSKSSHRQSVHQAAAENRGGTRRTSSKQAVPFLAFFILLILFAVVGASFIFLSFRSPGSFLSTAIERTGQTTEIEAAALPDDRITSIALFAVDSDNDEFQGKANSVIILTVDNKHGKLKLASVFDSTLFSDEHDEQEKIALAYETSGAEDALSILNEAFQLEIEDYITVNFAHTAALIDAVGGLEISLSGDEIREMNNILQNLSQAVGRQAELDLINGEAHQYPVVDSDDFIRDIAGGLDLENGAYRDGSYQLSGNQAVAYAQVSQAEEELTLPNRSQTVFLLFFQRLVELNQFRSTSFVAQLLPHLDTSLTAEELVACTALFRQSFTVEVLRVPDSADAIFLTGEDKKEINGEEASPAQYSLKAAANRLHSFLYEEDSPYWEEYGNTSVTVNVDSD